MRTIIIALMSIITLGLGFWAYKQNYATRQALSEVREVKSNIRSAKAELNMLKAEWRFLNRPDRLQELIEENYVTLQLQPMRPGQAATADEIPYYSYEYDED